MSDEAKQKIARAAERARWAEFQRIYERCIAIADATWSDRLDGAQIVQQTLAEGMRDRPSDPGNTWDDGSIPVPLFTPRDREQFVKEVATALLISAERRNLTAIPEPKASPDASKEQAPGEAPAAEAASGVDEMLDREVGDIISEGVGQP